MLAFIAQRLGKAVIVLLAIVVLNFFLIRLAPGVFTWISSSPGPRSLEPYAANPLWRRGGGTGSAVAPELSDDQVLERGRAYIMRWIDAGWIRVSDAPLYPSKITTLSDSLSFLQQHGTAATRYLENSPSIDPTDEAIRVMTATI